jgi:hypothetical protein
VTPPEEGVVNDEELVTTPTEEWAVPDWLQW